MKLRSKVFIFLILCICLTTSIVGISIYKKSEELIEKIFIQLIADNQQAIKKNIQSFFNEKLSDIEIMEQQKYFKDFKSYDEISKELLKIRNAYKNYESFELIDQNRIRRLHTSLIDINEAYEPRDVIEKIFKEKNREIKLIINSSYHKGKIQIFSPIKDQDNNVKYILISNIPIDKTSDAIDLPESEMLKFIKPKIELRTADDKIIFQNHHDSESINFENLSSTKINDSSAFYHSNQNLIIESSFPISYYNEHFNWKILTKIDTEEVVRPFKDLFSNIMLWGILFLSCLFFISHKLIHNLVTPLESLSLYMKKLADGQFEKIPMNGKFSAEFTSLINGYNLMLEKLKMSLAESNKNSKFAALGQMATGIAHEINNPLAIIKGLSYSLPKFIELKNFDKAKENVKKIEATVDRIAKIIKSLRAYARDESQDPFKKENVREIVDATLDLCHERIKNQGLKLILEYDQEDLYVPARGFQISQILLNLLNNAADELKTTTDPWIKITSLKIENEKIKITVENSGPKIPMSVAENLFVPFFTTKEVGKGTGLGLMISQNIARSHQGELGLDMTGEHTKFVLILPEFIESSQFHTDSSETSDGNEKKVA